MQRHDLEQMTHLVGRRQAIQRSLDPSRALRIRA
jgi:hypothetical protein